MSGSPAVPAVALRSVSKSFGGSRAVDSVSFDVGKGVCFGLLGPNGAGKSTTLKMIHGALRPSEGSVLVGGYDLHRQPREAKALLGVAPQENLLDPDLDVTQNLVFHGRYFGYTRGESLSRCRRLLDFMGLADQGPTPVSHLSTGLRRRLVLARALLSDPAIVILDEPTRGLDRESRGLYIERLQNLKAKGVTVILATHELREAEALCDRAALMEAGRILAAGSLWHIISDGSAEQLMPPVTAAD